eukprot:CAMPEP_0176103966 /NCGR_PEP_ID=MMETSP0120_2-20121206/52163_1 /TAXON_ID=160619 /ORGANISM="Kryptoperidinium foliaceum, Strain CCMP 1326" /LENGTH=37 /DNA_ID= /DNA_START= /DNA_END= /DNA_ORIENTATION=
MRSDPLAIALTALGEADGLATALGAVLVHLVASSSSS